MDIGVYVLPVFQIMLLDIVLSGDNVGVIALAIRNLPEKQAKTAGFAGIACALLIRVIFVCILSYVMSIEWLHIKLIGGILLIKITLDLMKVDEQTGDDKNQKVINGFFKAILTIIIADVSMSFDNVLALSSAANGNDLLVLFGLVLNIPIIFFGSQIVSKLMQKYALVIFAGAALLMHTSILMILEDEFVQAYVSHAVVTWLPWAAALVVFIYGLYAVRKLKMSEKIADMEEGA